jgi:hypothetical protein
VRARLVVARRAWLWVLAWPLALGAAIVALRLPTGPALVAWLSAGALLPLAWLWLRRSISKAAEVRGVFSVDHELVRFDGATIATRDELSQGWLLPATDKSPARLRLERRGRPPVVLSFDDEAAARDALTRLGLDADRATVEASFRRGARGVAPVSSAHGLVAWALSLSCARLAAVGPEWAALAVPAIALAVFGTSASIAETRVRVGTDGLDIRWLWWRRFVPMARVVRASRALRLAGGTASVSVLLELTEGEHVVLPVGGIEREPEALAFVARVLEARRAFDSLRRDADCDSVRRRGRSPTAWLAHLRTVAAGADVDPRTAPTSRETLLSVVEDPASRPALRVGAAIALSASATPSERRRIRVAGRSSAVSAVSFALSRIADPEADDAELARVLVAAERS